MGWSEVSVVCARLYRRLTRDLAAAEEVAFSEGVTAEEYALQAEWEERLEPLLIALSLLIVARLADVPRRSEAAIRAWLVDQYERDPMATLPLRWVLQTYLRRGVEVGGQAALELLALDGVFRLQDAELLALLDAHATDLVAFGTEFSLLDTTVEELAALLWTVLQDDRAASVATLAQAVRTHAETRGPVRAALIAETELARATAAGLVWTFGRNGVARVRFWPREDACPVCLPKRGAIFPVDRIPASHAIPLHPRCRCIWLPVRDDDASPPATVWAGGANA